MEEQEARYEVEIMIFESFAPKLVHDHPSRGNVESVDLASVTPAFTDGEQTIRQTFL